jgi:hypothetical protein
MKTFKEFVNEQGPPMEGPWGPIKIPTPIGPNDPRFPKKDPIDYDEPSWFTPDNWEDLYDPEDSDGNGIPDDEDPNYVEPEPIDLQDIWPTWDYWWK